MKLSVLALDYDGTIARDDRLAPEVRAAAGAARSSGITVALVTGRILDELLRVAGDLHFVDVVVAENGGVVHFPASGYTAVLAPEVPAALLTELAARRVSFRAGTCLVDAAAEDGLQLTDIIRALELPLVLLFNRGRVMVLPQGVSKATGLQAALDMLRLSPRNTLAIGDAENDHEMLRLAEVGAAVEWGSPVLRAAADIVVRGSGPAAVAALVADAARSRVLPRPNRARRRLRLGYTDEGEEFSLAVRGRNVLIAGDAKSGKSWVAGLLTEQLIFHGYSVCVIDPEGDYRSLEALPGVSVLGGEDPPPTPRELLRAFRYPDRSVVIDLSRLSQPDKFEYIRAALPGVNALRRRTGLPHRLVLDEAHYFLHDASALDLLDLRANGYTVVTYFASRLPPELLAAAEVMIVTCESSPAEVEALWRSCARCSRGADQAHWRRVLATLPIGSAVALPVTEEAEGGLKLFTLGNRLTPHVRHRQKYCDVPVTEGRAFVFTADAAAPLRRTATLREFVRELEGRPIDALDGYLRRGDFSRWIRDVFGDYSLAGEIGEQEEMHRRGGAEDVGAGIASAIRARYDLGEHEENGAIQPAGRAA